MSEEAQIQIQPELQDGWQDAASSWAHRLEGYWRQWLWIIYLCTSSLGLGPDTQRMLDTFWIMNEWINESTNQQTVLEFGVIQYLLPLMLPLSTCSQCLEKGEGRAGSLAKPLAREDTSERNFSKSSHSQPLWLSCPFGPCWLSSLTFRCLPSVLLEVAEEKFLHSQEKAIHSPWLSFLRVFSGKTEPFSSAM